jgi:hypothetical protein
MTRHLGAAGLAVAVAACGAAPQPPGAPTAVYNKATGALEQLISDRNGDGRPDTWAHMNGTRIVQIDIDRDNDGRPDRWEYYSQPLPDGSPTVIERADDADGPDRTTVTRRERYVRGVLASVEEDTDDDGRVDKWETYDAGRLSRVDLDLTGRGTPSRRLVYAPDGTTRVEPVPGATEVPPAAPPPAASTRKKVGTE